MRSRRLRLSIAVAALALFAGCGSSETDGAASTATPAPAGDVAAAPSGVPAVLDFTAPLVGGGEYSGALAAGKPTAFWFWAPT
jgi:hypothetical protein